MSGDVVIQMSAQDAEMVAAWQRARQGPAAVEAELQKLARTGKRAGKELADSFSTTPITDMTAALVSAAAPFVLLTRAAGLFRQELERIRQQQRQIVESQLSVNDAWRGAAMQLTGVDTGITPDILYEKIVGGARGVDQASLFRTFQNSMPAAGTLKPEDVLEMTLESTRLAPQWGEQERVAMVSGALQVQQAFGVTPQEAFAGSVQLSAADRTVDAEALGTNILPTIASLAALGGGKDSFEYLAAKVSAFGQRAGDPQGRRTGTNIINLMRQVKEELVSSGLASKDASIEEMFQTLEANPQIQQKMLGVFADTELGTSKSALQRQIMERRKSGGEFSTEARTFVAAMETLQPGSPGNKTTEQFIAAQEKLLGLTPEAIAAVEKQAKELADSKYSITTETERGRTQTQKEWELLNIQGGIRGAIDKKMETAYGIAGPAAFTPNIGMGRMISGAISPFLSDETYAIGQQRMIREFLAPATTDPERKEALNKLVEEMRVLIEAIRENQKNPTKVTIEGDNRPNVLPQKAPVAGINDGGG